MEILNPANQGHWAQIIEASIYDKASVGRAYGINAKQLSLYERGLVKPQNETMKRMIEIMTDLSNKPKMVKPPSFGYATPEEIAKINSMGVCPERDRLLEIVKKRNAAKGKVKA